MESKTMFIVRIVIVIMTASLITLCSGIIGFIDILQLMEVFFGTLLMAIVIRVFWRKGLVFIAEYTALLAGVLFMLLGLVQTWMIYGELTIQIVSIYMLSVFYGLCFSLINTVMIWGHKKKVRQGRGMGYE